MRLKVSVKFRLNPFLLVLIGLISSTYARSQSRCGTVVMQQNRIGLTAYKEKMQQFEQWLSKSMQRQALSPNFGRTKQVIRIPVVVHIIHNGEEIGLSVNIPDDQVFSQIDILNKDFRRLNDDAAKTPPQFTGVAADSNIEFVLAKRDPEGLTSTGIVRKKGVQTEYRIIEDKLLKSMSFWPSEDYLNIWVTRLGDDLLGYAQFPVSNLNGLMVDRENNRLTDGVVIDYRYFGSGYNNDPFSKGRTATHEIGHFLGLRHIWGDGGCSSDDFCLDTPPMSMSSSGCPDNSQDSCAADGSPDMFQNYMDFTDDNCMNLFTICQANRMQAVLSESPRRKSLITSNSLTPPLLTKNDMGIRRIISPEVSVCTTSILPEIEVRNYGTNNINSFEVSIEINGSVIETLRSTTALNPLDMISISFQPIMVSQGMEIDFAFRIAQVNDGIDENKENDVKTLRVQVPVQVDLPIIADFENGNDGWMTRTITGSSSDWKISNAPLNTSDNKAYNIDIFNSATSSFGSLEMLLSPVINLEKATAELQFHYAYAPTNGNFIDGLAVAVLTECGVLFDPINISPDFEKYGLDLATTNTQNNAFVPTGKTEWNDATISLSKFLGLKDVQVAFIYQNGGGNNIYVDEVQILAQDKYKLDVRVAEVVQLPLISCYPVHAPIVNIKNFGSDVINSIDYQYGVNNNSQTGNLEGISLKPGAFQDIAVSIDAVADGEYEFNFTVVAINNKEDEDPKDNTLKQKFRVTRSEDTLPLRERFEQRSFDELAWFPFSKTGVHNWEFFSLSEEQESDQAIGISAFDLDEVGTQNWLVSPRLDLSDLDHASMTFDVSYANRLNLYDRLQLLVSTDCGKNFNEIAYDKKGIELAVTTSNTAWSPMSSNDWITESVNLNAFAGMPDVLLAFVFTNSNGNNLYLDNFNFFITAEPSLIDFDNDNARIYPNPALTEFNVTLNLDEKEELQIHMIDLMGKVIAKQVLKNALNQTLQFSTLMLQNGLYLIQFTGEDSRFTKRVIVIR